jgi:hypothetical protein
VTLSLVSKEKETGTCFCSLSIRNGSSLHQCYDIGICTLLEGGLLGARSHDKVSVWPACMSDLGHGTRCGCISRGCHGETKGGKKLRQWARFGTASSFWQSGHVPVRVTTLALEQSLFQILYLLATLRGICSAVDLDHPHKRGRHISTGLG